MFTFAVNLLVPIICLGVLCSTIGYWNKATLALEIKYNGSVIGYAKNESEYLDAEQQAKQGSKPLRLPPVRSRSLLSLRSISSRS